MQIRISARAKSVLEGSKSFMNRWKGIALGVVAVGTMFPAAMGQGAKQSGAEIGLLGIKLYDKFQVLIQRFGSPDELLAVSIGTSTTGGAPTGGAPGGMGGPGGGGQGGPGMPGGKGKGGGGGSAMGAADWDVPFFGGQSLRQKGVGGSQAPGVGGDGGQRGGPPSGFGGPGGPPPGFSGGGGAPSGQSQSSGLVELTRYVYNRNNNKYGFIVNKFGQIVQIEVVGLENKAVHTRKGITLGSNFAQVIRSYQTPDAYEISGDNVVLRYLSRNKLAFRLTRLGPKKPQVVTGIVIAAAKN